MTLDSYNDQNRNNMKKKHPEPEHYSWNLGKPDNSTGTEVIVNPYSNSFQQQAPGWNNEDSWEDDRKEFDGIAEMNQSYKDSGINPFPSAYTIEVDGKHIIVPQVDHLGRGVSEDDAVNNYLENKRSLGIFSSEEEAQAHRQSRYQEAIKKRTK